MTWGRVSYQESLILKWTNPLKQFSEYAIQHWEHLQGLSFPNQATASALSSRTGADRICSESVFSFQLWMEALCGLRETCSLGSVRRLVLTLLSEDRGQKWFPDSSRNTGRIRRHVQRSTRSYIHKDFPIVWHHFQLQACHFSDGN